MVARVIGRSVRRRGPQCGLRRLVPEAGNFGGKLARGRAVWGECACARGDVRVTSLPRDAPVEKSAGNRSCSAKYRRRAAR